MGKISRVLLLFSVILVLGAGTRTPMTSATGPVGSGTIAEVLFPVQPPTPTRVGYPAKEIHRISFHYMSPDPERRALWVWDRDMVDDDEARAVFLEFIESKRVDTIYLSARNLLSGHCGALEDFLDELGDVEVEWLAGDPSFVLAENRSKIMEFIQKVVAFRQKVNRDGRPGTIHLDIEPYLLDEWTTNQDEIITQYLDLLRAVKNKLAVREGPSLRLGVDIPFWFDRIEATYNAQTKPLNQYVQDISDYVVIMDYRDSPDGRDGIIRNAGNELRYGLQIGKPVTVGVETKCIEPEKITFCEEGEKVLNQVLKDVKSSLEKNPAFNGFAIHQYRAYRKLAERALLP